MDTMLQNGDFARGPGGLLRPIQGVLELTQRAMIRLTVRKGAFPLDDTLGSELYRLRDVKKPHWQEMRCLSQRLFMRCTRTFGLVFSRTERHT